jgi:AraC-like DNA-binding protein
MSEDTNYIQLLRQLNILIRTKEQHGLSEMAEHVHLSQAHFQRILQNGLELALKSSCNISA